jgi:hypothetical protein
MNNARKSRHVLDSMRVQKTRGNRDTAPEINVLKWLRDVRKTRRFTSRRALRNLRILHSVCNLRTLQTRADTDTGLTVRLGYR